MRFLVYKNGCIFAKSQANSKVRYSLERLKLRLSIDVVRKSGSHIDFSEKIMFYPKFSCFLQHSAAKIIQGRSNLLLLENSTFSKMCFYLIFFCFIRQSSTSSKGETTLVCSSWWTRRCLATREVSRKMRFLVYKNKCTFTKSQPNSKARYALERLNLGLSIDVDRNNDSHIDFCKKI